MILIIARMTYERLTLDTSATSTSTPSTPSTTEHTVEKIPSASIAVLPFVNMSSDTEQEYFSDGISEEILNVLAKIPNLHVTSRSSAFSFKGKAIITSEIAKKLEVKHVLEGGVRKYGNRIRITAQLIEADSDKHLWSETYERELKDIFIIQEAIAISIASKLALKLNVQQSSSLISSQTQNIPAYNLYLQAKHLSLQHNVEANRNAENIIRQSISLDPDYAPAWNLLSMLILEATSNFSMKDVQEGFKTSKAAAQKSKELDNLYAPAYATLAKNNIMEWNFDAADTNIQKALALDSGDAYIISIAASIAGDLGNSDEIKLWKQAIKLDPLEYRYSHALADTLYAMKRNDEAYQVIQNALLFQPNMGMSHTLLSFILLERGQKKEALLEIQKEPVEFWRSFGKICILFSMDRTDESNILLTQFINQYGERDPENVADIYALRGDIENAFKWLNLATKKSHSSLLAIIQYSHFEILYQDPRWDDLLNEIKLPKNHWLWSNKAR